mmetsp:Transcript_1009/g.1687  ORF Transcript_1009/g.1687 Transcript_1009/m.1687 type:complete len:464 (-) Transcript_1009:110-1501(-)|eukprot:CAMPEP_0184288338 /NCGR_PEP_ID=MMETSP1049-20130417/860_1 /TAXON_ID=77928 /ORGANISM="Proteomonas sulcata, Strain CCMP704" /LENGTH=463 /DNA_ID=CAMNT_0026594683 /DNA_START=121 /DNA_END=1512 /DNA_ORIENTATION=-
MADSTVKYFLPESEAPTHWYNIQADLPKPLPPVLHPGTHQPVGPDDLAPLFPPDLIMQEVSQERWIEIPDEVQQVYKAWRPSPLYRARALEKALGTPAKIFYKYEGVSPTGSHKPNTAVPQVYYNKKAGTKKITTETGAGQWGSSLAYAGAQFGVDIEVFQVKISFETKPYRGIFMNTFGAQCYPSPSDRTEVGKAILAKDPECTGSLGIAISEAVESCVKSDVPTKYCLGSVLNHVLMHQTVIGLEAIKQLEMAGETPDVLVGCTGGGSNFAGMCLPFLGQKFRGESKKPFRTVAVEPAACPSLTKGKYAYDFGDTGKMTPLMKTHTLGHPFMPPPDHAGGLRYHGMAPIVSHLKQIGELEAVAYKQTECFEAGILFAKSEGILPAPEANHAVKGAIEEALRCKQSGSSEVILFNLCGHGNFDMAAYDKFNAGKMQDNDFKQEDMAMALAAIPAVKEASTGN